MTTMLETTSTSKRNIEDAPLNSFHKRLTAYSAAAPFLDGYIISVIGVVMLQLTGALSLNVAEQGLVAAGPLIGMFFGGFLIGILTDRIGRKLLYVLVLMALVVFSLMQFWVTEAWMLIALRLLLGIAIGADHPLATSLLAEFLPRRSRGPILASLVVYWFVGAGVAYVVGDLILRFGGDDAWRWAIASAAVPGAVFLLLRSGTPESARWLLSKGRVDEADKVIQKVYGGAYSIDDLPEPKSEDKVTIASLFRSGYGKRMLFVSVFWTCSVIPPFAIYAFAPTILASLGIEDGAASIGQLVITGMFVVGCVIATLVIGKVGRRRLLIHSFVWSGLALLLLAIFPNAGTLAVLVLFASYAVFIGGAQVLQYVYPNELFPTQIRGTAMGLGTSASRIGAAIGTYLVPVGLTTIGIAGTMYIAAGVSLVGLLVSVFMAPATDNMDLHEASTVPIQTIKSN